MKPSFRLLALTAALLLPAGTRAQSYAWNDITPAPSTECYDVAPSRAATGALVLYASCRTGLLRSDDGGATWAVVLRPGRFAPSFAVSYRDAEHVYALNDDSLLASDAGGRRWRTLRSARAGTFTRMEVSPFDARRLLLVGTASTHASLDGGETFVVTTYPYESHDGNIVNAVPSYRDPDRFVAHAHSYGFTYPFGSNLLFDQSWTGGGSFVTGTSQPCTWQTCLLTDTTGAVYLGSRRTRDGGRTFEPVTSGGTGLAIVATSPENAVAYAVSGTYGAARFHLSGDDGRTWRPVAEGSLQVYTPFALDPRDSTLYTANAGRLLALRRVAATTADEPAGPAALTLAPPAPNPARGPVTIRFALDRVGPTRLTVHDALGREVAVLADEAQPEGAHAATLDAASLAPGLYLVRLGAGDRSATRPLVVVR